MTAKKLPVQVTSQPRNASGLSVQTALEDPSILLYALLALCMVLLVFSLCLAMVIFLRRRSETNADQAVVKQGQGSARRRGQLGSKVKG